MLRKACGSFVLMRAGDLPGDPEVEVAYSLDGVFVWLKDCPDQIERAVICSSRRVGCGTDVANHPVDQFLRHKGVANKCWSGAWDSNPTREQPSAAN